MIEVCRRHGIHILHDEIFHGLGPTGAEHLPLIADEYELGLSLGVTSKSFGLPGLRVGWIVSQDRDVLERMERLKHYVSICSSGPSERLAIVTLQHRDELLARNNSIIDENLPKWDSFFARVVPSTTYRSDLGQTPTDRFRIGAGRSGLDEGLAAMSAHLDAVALGRGAVTC